MAEFEDIFVPTILILLLCSPFIIIGFFIYMDQQCWMPVIKNEICPKYNATYFELTREGLICSKNNTEFIFIYKEQFAMEKKLRC